MQELSKAERAALFKQQNQAKIDAQKAAKESAKLSKQERAEKQEAQRAAKAAAQGKDVSTASGAAPPAAPAGSGAIVSGGGGKVGGGVQHDDPKAVEKAKKSSAGQRTEMVDSKKVPWFQHLRHDEREASLSQKLSKTSKRAHSLRQDNDIHPAILSLGLKFGDWLIGNRLAPCVALADLRRRAGGGGGRELRLVRESGNCKCVPDLHFGISSATHSQGGRLTAGSWREQAYHGDARGL